MKYIQAKLYPIDKLLMKFKKAEINRFQVKPKLALSTLKIIPNNTTKDKGGSVAKENRIAILPLQVSKKCQT
jgi:hypothetical protein